MNNCNNCDKQGHQFHQCRLPITSIGIILFRIQEGKLQFLMIRRKDTFGYIDIMRGKYSMSNMTQLQSIVDEMSVAEKERLTTIPFSILWKKMWGDTAHYNNEETSASKKCELIKKGLNDDGISLQELIRRSTTNWTETEWEFPKGRRERKEKEIQCALREFEEGTGIGRNRITIIENLLPFEETYIGTNFKSYKHKYFLAYTKDKTSLNNFQKSEVSKLEWTTYEDCLLSIRPYHLEKKKNYY
jgi:ADP-ribose pyrophosphatase YjhB (NUDIX family)